MDHLDDKREIAELERVNADLTASLGRCRALLKDCRSKLAANSNDAEQGRPDEDAETA